MENQLLKDSQEAFKEEIDSRRLSITGAEYYPEAFGNAWVILENSDFRLRLSIERSEYYAFVAPAIEPERWTWLQMGIKAARGEIERSSAKRPPDAQIDVHGAASLVRQHFHELVRGFGRDWSTTSTILVELESRYQEQMMAWLGSAEATEELEKLNKEAAEALKNPSEALKEALKCLDDE